MKGCDVSDTSTPASLEARRLELDEKRLELENSFARKWFPTLATMIAGVVATLLSFGVTERARIDARTATQSTEFEAKKKDEREWGIKVVELYLDKRDLFDLARKPDQAGANLRMLAVVAPEAVKGVLDAETALIPKPGAEDDDAARINSLTQIASIQNVLQPKSPEGSASSNAAKIAARPNSDFTVYIQYPAGSRDLALSAQATLQAQGYRAPAIEEVRQVPNHMQVRYYRPEQKDRAAGLLHEVGETLKLTTDPGDALQLKSQKQLPDGILELWLPKPAA
jgi:hypothetical protein